MFAFYVILFLLGLVFWSFSTVLIERWRSGKWWIVLWRSECPKCNHMLWVTELFPVLSYLFQWWRCRNCSAHISPFYPLAELFFALIFCTMGYLSISFWNDPVSWGTSLFLILWFITGIYVFYDIRYMEIPDQIMIPSIVWYIILIILWGIYPSISDILFDFYTYSDSRSFMIDHFRAAVFIYSFFYLQILIPGGFFLLRKWKTKQFLELLFSYFLFPIELILSFFIKPKNTKDDINNDKNEEEIPSWIGWWDLRVAIFIWLTLWSTHTLSTLFFAYIIGSVVGCFLLMTNYGNRNHQVPFWPFLWAGWILSLLLYNTILNFF